MQHVDAIPFERKARHDYTVEDSFEAGIVLTGSEVKSLREGNAQIAEGYARVRRGEMWILAHNPVKVIEAMEGPGYIVQIVGKAVWFVGYGARLNQFGELQQEFYERDLLPLTQKI